MKSKDNAISEIVGVILILLLIILGLSIVLAFILGNIHITDLPSVELVFVDEFNRTSNTHTLYVIHNGGESLSNESVEIKLNGITSTCDSYFSHDHKPFCDSGELFSTGKKLIFRPVSSPIQNCSIIYKKGGGDKSGNLMAYTERLVRVNSTTSVSGITSNWSEDNIPPVISPISINPPPPLDAGSTATASWTVTDQIPVFGAEVKLGGPGVNTVLGSSVYNQITFNVPLVSGSGYYLRVSVKDMNYNEAQKTSEIFTIRDIPKVTLESPNGGETWTVGETRPIVWVANSLTGISRTIISFSNTGGSSWVEISNPAGSSPFPWIIPPSAVSLISKINVTACNPANFCGSDISEGVFLIQSSVSTGSITVISPAIGDILIGGEEFPIKWTITSESNIIDINLEYSLDGITWNTIESGLPNSTEYNWLVPDLPNQNTQIRVIAQAEDGSQLIGLSGIFTIKQIPPLVNIESPNGGEIWPIDSSQIIKWNATSPSGIESVDLLYSISDSPVTRNIALGIANTGSHPWVVEPVPSEQVRVIVKARGLNGLIGSDKSENFFSVRDITSPSIIVTIPQGGERWYPNPSSNPQKIVWSASDNVNVEKISLEYSIDGGISYMPIKYASTLNNLGYFYWYIPNTSSTTCKVKATADDFAGNSASNVSNGLFRIG